MLRVRVQVVISATTELVRLLRWGEALARERTWVGMTIIRWKSYNKTNKRIIIITTIITIIITIIIIIGCVAQASAMPIVLSRCVGTSAVTSLHPPEVAGPAITSTHRTFIWPAISEVLGLAEIRLDAEVATC